MDKNIKMLVWVVIGLSLALFLSESKITGKAASSYCSEIPEITSIEAVGYSVSVNWKDTSTYEGQLKYEALLFKKGEDGTYNFNNPIRSDIAIKPYITFQKLWEGTYKVKVRARNKASCETEYTDYSESDEVTTRIKTETG